uniref:Galectin n=1 Tax=Amphiprion ocellaris TaxID=80972 RepID=A0AAQ6AKZ1_AMPOC
MTTWSRRGLPAGVRVPQSSVGITARKPPQRITPRVEWKKRTRKKIMEVILSSRPQEEDTEGDVGLQLKVSFREKAVQRNARLAGKWGSAENTLSFFPFAAGEPFKMEIVCEHQQFRILVDGQPLCGFTHRLSQLASLTALRVFGDLQLTKVA